MFACKSAKQSASAGRARAARLQQRGARNAQCQYLRARKSTEPSWVLDVSAWRCAGLWPAERVRQLGAFHARLRPIKTRLCDNWLPQMARTLWLTALIISSEASASVKRNSKAPKAWENTPAALQSNPLDSKVQLLYMFLEHASMPPSQTCRIYKQLVIFFVLWLHFYFNSYLKLIILLILANLVYFIPLTCVVISKHYWLHIPRNLVKLVFTYKKAAKIWNLIW
jgi:hypothetical protein